MLKSPKEYTIPSNTKKGEFLSRLREQAENKKGEIETLLEALILREMARGSCFGSSDVRKLLWGGDRGIAELAKGLGSQSDCISDKELEAIVVELLPGIIPSEGYTHEVKSYQGNDTSIYLTWTLK